MVYMYITHPEELLHLKVFLSYRKRTFYVEFKYQKVAFCKLFEKHKNVEHVFIFR